MKNQTAELLSLIKMLGLNETTLTQTMVSTIKNGSVYSVAYGSESNLFPGQYSVYLPVFQEMVGSYKIEPLGNPIETDNQNKNQSNPIEDFSGNSPCTILKVRLANGNISISEFEKLDKIIGCG